MQGAWELGLVALLFLSLQAEKQHGHETQFKCSLHQ